MANVVSNTTKEEIFHETTLKELRESLNVSQTVAALELEVSRQQYVAWEKSIDCMSVRTLRKVCEYYGCSPADLVY